VGVTQPRLPELASLDLVLRWTSDGWRIEDAHGRGVCDRLDRIAEARLVARTIVSPRGRVWVRDDHGWSVLDDD